MSWVEPDEWAEQSRSESAPLARATLDPLAASGRIASDYVRYLRTAYSPANPLLRAEFEEQLGTGRHLTKGPILQAQAPYTVGSSIAELISDGVLPGALDRLAASDFGIERPLYRHQEEAIRKLRSDRNVIVATGTGSGKTESFMVPILAHLAEEIENGTISQPGVRALLLYPMNALANDQLARLRDLLREYPEITFGRYVGDTERTDARALDKHRLRFAEDPQANELISRTQMQESPPHILLTNFAMLEYLLLRPEEQRFFDGATGDHWRFLVLDEVHVYDGAKGAEIAMLLRRLRDRVNSSERGRLQCIGTSATLGRGVEDAPRLVGFAEEVFDEAFEWVENDPDRQDLVVATRDELATGEPTWSCEPTAFPSLRDAYRSGASPEDLLQVLAGAVSIDKPTEGETTEEWLGRILGTEEHVVALQRILTHGSVDLAPAAAEVIGPAGDAPEQLTALVDTCVSAEVAGTERALIPARWHYLLRSLEGAFACLNPKHPDGVPRLSLSRRARCPTCSRDKPTAMFELEVCQRCGARYVVGEMDNEATHPALVAPGLLDAKLRHFLLEGALVTEDDEDDLATSGEDGAANQERRSQVRLCTGCGALGERGQPQCGCGVEILELTEVHPASRDSPVRSCGACGNRTSAGSILRRFLTGADAPVSVVATSLYQELPPVSSSKKAVGSGRKLLSFADSRQDAAFFAPYLERTYNRAVQRRLIWRALEQVSGGDPAGRHRLGSLRPVLRNLALREEVIAEFGGELEPDQHAKHWLYAEVLSTDRQQNLEGVGLAEVAVPIPDGMKAPTPLLQLGLNEEEALELAAVLLDSVRRSRAVTIDPSVDLAEPIFEGRPTTAIRGSGSEQGVLSWNPTRGTNRRIEYLQKVLSELGSGMDPAELLAAMWDKWLTVPNGGWGDVLVASGDTLGRGTLYRINTNALEFQPASEEHQPYQCSNCKQVWWRHVRHLCPSVRCEGRLERVSADALFENHYRRLYTDLSTVGMRVEEHTAQLSADLGARRQQEFLDGKINVLSCSTTFELGVDVGEIQAVLMRNIPPKASNYVQRAGRAGRRAGSPALVVSFAQRRSHDLHFFDHPHSMIDGYVATPVVEVDNPVIVRRHLGALAFAEFLRIEDAGRLESTFRTVEEFFSPRNESASDRFLDWLESTPEELGAAVARVCPNEVGQSPEIDLENWEWARSLGGDPKDPSRGRLVRVADEVLDEFESMREELENAYAARQGKRIPALERMVRTLGTVRTIDRLAQRGILPKYGFPVDVVSLQVPADAELSLSRDLSQAIVDFMPGAELIANKRLWRSNGIRIPAGLSMVVHEFAKCAECETFRSWLDELEPPPCRVCDSEALDPSARGRFVEPRFGFVGEGEAQRPGDRRPPKLTSRSFFFNDYVGGAPEFADVAIGASNVRMRTSRQGQITVLAGGFRGVQPLICRWCGWGMMPPAPGQPVPDHARPTGRRQPCDGHANPLSLGHIYLTDTVELRLPGSLDGAAALSTLHALLAASEDVGIAHDDINGTLHGGATGASLILFDSVPGGAGHARRITEELPALFEGALRRVADCDCGPETSCYGCLRSYRNQFDHDRLVRGAALQTLERLGVVQ